MGAEPIILNSMIIYQIIMECITQRIETFFFTVIEEPNWEQ